MKIIFMGTPDYATIIFKKILEENLFNVIALYTQPDKPVGRKKILTPPHIKKYCLNNNIKIPIFQPKTLKDTEQIKNIKNLNPDLIIVAAYGQILPQSILDIAPCINLHASILPKYRGASPIQQAILNNDEYTGVTAMLMEASLDSGDILGYRFVKIKNKDIEELFDELSYQASKLTIDVIKNYKNIKPLKQNKTNVSYCKKITKIDGLVEFKNAKDIYTKYKAYKYWPGIYLNNGLKLKEIEFIENSTSNKAGEIISISKNYIVLGCQIGTIKIITVQPKSKKAMNIIDYIRGKRITLKDILN